MTHFPVIPERFLQGVKTRKQLAGEYDMSESTFYRHLKKHHLHRRLPSGLLRPLITSSYIKRWGHPCCLPFL